MEAGEMPVEPAAAVPDADDDWCVACSDEEGEGDKTVWEPEPKVIVELYNKLCEDKVIELEWKNPGRRPPESEEDKSHIEESMEVEEQEEIEEEPTEFDFDSIEPEPTVTPRRTPGVTKTPRTHRVARMDKILDDIFKQKMDNISKGSNKSPNSPRSPRVAHSPVVASTATSDTVQKYPDASEETEKDPFGS